MRPLLALALAALATPAAAQLALPEARTIGIPLFMGAGEMDFGNGTTASGVTSPVPGFVATDFDRTASLGRYVVIDVSGGMAVVACFAIPCSGLPEERNGVEVEGDGAVFLDGVLLPRFDAGLLLPTPLGGVGGGFTLGASGISSAEEAYGWVDLGGQLAYGAAVGPAQLVATGTYAVGFEGGSQALTGRAVKVRADVVVPRDGIDLVGFVSFDRHTDSQGTDAEADDFRSSFLTFGAGIGF